MKESIEVEVVAVAEGAARTAEEAARSAAKRVEEVMSGEDRRRRGRGRLIAGVCLMALGVLFLADSLFDIDVGYVWNYWPLILVAIGVSKLTGARRSRGIGGGIFLIVLGGFFLFDELDIFYAEDSWPVLLMTVGALMVVSSFARNRAASDSS